MALLLHILTRISGDFNHGNFSRQFQLATISIPSLLDILAFECLWPSSPLGLNVYQAATPSNFSSGAELSWNGSQVLTSLSLWWLLRRLPWLSWSLLMNINYLKLCRLELWHGRVLRRRRWIVVGGAHVGGCVRCVRRWKGGWGDATTWWGVGEGGRRGVGRGERAKGGRRKHCRAWHKSRRRTFTQVGELLVQIQSCFSLFMGVQGLWGNFKWLWEPLTKALKVSENTTSASSTIILEQWTWIWNTETLSGGLMNLKLFQVCTWHINESLDRNYLFWGFCADFVRASAFIPEFHGDLPLDKFPPFASCKARDALKIT